MYDDQGRHKRRGSADAIFPGFGRGVLEEAGPGPRTLTEKFASVEAKFPVRVYPHNGRLRTACSLDAVLTNLPSQQRTLQVSATLPI